MFDVVITGGTIIDGTGKPAYKSDLGIKGEKISAIGDLTKAEKKDEIDASGLTVTPGFIDTHAHSEGMLLIDPQHSAGLRQGITTEILGQDGLSYAPLSRENYHTYRRYLAGILGEPPLDLDMSTVESFRSHYHKKTAINTAYLVAHGALRLESIGFHDAPMIGDALTKAKRLLKEGMEQGAVGLCTGLSYHPHAWSDTSELINLCEVTNEAGGIYVTHLRDVNPERGYAGGGVPEALEIGRRSGVPVHFSHYRTHSYDAGQVEELVAPIDKAIAEGVNCTLELYPYPTGSGLPMSYLPSYAHEGGPDAIIKCLQDPTIRAKIANDLEHHVSGDGDLVNTSLSYFPINSHLEGMSLSEISTDMKGSLGEILCDLLLEEDLSIAFCGRPPTDENILQQINLDALQLLSRPDYMIGSDSILLGSIPHPRGYGTFPRFLKLRRELGVLSLEEMIQRMTDNPARRFNLKNRGRIEKGYFADAVVFDSENITDNATYEDPRQFPSGIPYVLVNGKIAVDREKCTGVLAGQAIP